MSWKPIDRAPHDGTEIVVAFRRLATDVVVVAVSRFEDDQWRRLGDQDESLTAGDVPFAWVEKPV